MAYDDKINQELQTFKNNINVHEVPEALGYCDKKYLQKQLKNCIGFSTFETLVIKYINILKTDKDEKDIKICSLGSGNCDVEINIADACEFKGKIYCYDVNSDMLERGRKSANDKGIRNFEFINCDINDIQLNLEFDIVLALFSLHHFVKLEHIFDEVNRCMTNKSFFVIADMIGRNGHMFWDNTLDICNAIWSIFPKELKYNNQLKNYFEERVQWDCSNEGFEGVRAQDILPLLDEKFKFRDFAPYFAIINKFTDRDFGGNFDLTNDYHISLLDMICALDDFVLKNKILKPTQLLATMVKKDAEISDYRYLYFEDAKEIYLLDDKKFWDIFDHPYRLRFNEYETKASELEAQNKVKFNEYETKISELEAQRDEWRTLYNSNINSTCWKLTKPLRLFADFIKNIRSPKTSGES
jgi:ubiquinone/menaquinone biosynthesis C-methylase UbiE